MKKSFLLLLSLCWLTVHAQYISRTATYHFAKPASIGIDPSPSNGGTVALADKTMTIGYINATFGRETPNDAPPTIWTYKHPYQSLTEYYLRMTSGSTMTFTATNGCVIKTITFETEGTQGKLGNLQLRSGEFGKLNTETGVWNDEGVSPSSVTFRCGNSMAFISKVIVGYEESSVSLIPLISPSPTDTLYSFSSLELTYSGASGNMSVVSSTGITIQGDYDDTSLGSVDTTLTPTASGNKVLLTIADSIVKDGTFTIVVPARCFKDEEGYENTALTTTVTVREDRATFNPLSINPDTTDVRPELTFPIMLQFPNTTESRIGRVDENKTFYLSGMKEDSTWVPVSTLQAKKGEIKGLVRIIDKTELNSYKEHLKYRVEIPEGVVFNQFEPEDANSRHNASKNLIYTIGEPIPVDPLKEKKDSINMLVSEVDSLLANHAGKVGYPINSDTLLAVQNIKAYDTDNEELLVAKIDSLTGALKVFYNDTLIALPIKDKWYTVASVNNDNKEVFLSYANGAVTLGGTPIAFQVDSISSNGIVVLKVRDGKEGETYRYKYLHVLMTTDDYEYTSSKNVTDTKTYVNYLKLSKMLIPGDSVDQKPVVGLITVKGGMGNDSNGNKVGDAYARVVHGETPSIAMPNDTLYFECDTTSAFRFIKVDEPSDSVRVEAVIKDAVLTSNTQVMTLKIKGKDNDEDVTKVALKSLAGVKFTYIDGEETKEAICTADSILKPIIGTDTLFAVHVDGLADNIYTLVMPAGTFDFSENPKPVKDTDLEVSFKIESAPGPGPDDYANYGSLPEMWGTIPRLIIGFPVVDTDLLGVYYYVTDVDVYPNKDAAYNVVTLKERWMNTFIAQGHFEAVTRDSQHMLKIVYNEGTTLVDKLPLAKGDYTLVINRAAYGDEKFNERQNGNTSIPESECRINQSVIFNNFSVDNSITGIKNFNGDEQLSDGKYVIDGKFVIVKGGKKFTATGVAF